MKYIIQGAKDLGAEVKDGKLTGNGYAYYGDDLSQIERTFGRAEKYSITEYDNAITGASNLLTANTANTESTIFSYQLGNNECFVFRAYDKDKPLDKDTHGVFMKLMDTTTSTNFVRGRYLIAVYNSNGRDLKRVLSAGSIAKFGYQSTTTADLSDLNKKQTFEETVIALPQEYIKVLITARTVISTSVSLLELECTRRTM